jgi:two-component system nitrate/nitrite response regulator NarP
MTDVLLADDHPMIAAALDVLLRGTQYRLVGKVRSGSEALTALEIHNPDLALLDVNMPDGSGIDVLRSLRKARSKLPVILLTAGMDDTQLLAADELAPEGIVLKTADPAHLLECMDSVLAGRHWMDPDVAARLDELKQSRSSLLALTGRERELVALVREGLRNREIAERLGVTEGTVKVYMHGLFEKLRVNSRTELAMKAEQLGVA